MSSRPQGSIPNFTGAETAAERLRGLDVRKAARTLKPNPVYARRSRRAPGRWSLPRCPEAEADRDELAEAVAEQLCARTARR